MSRNLGVNTCYHCEHPVGLVSQAGPITEKYAGGYFPEYEGMIVAEARCPICLSHYLAWLDGTKRKKYSPYPKPQDPYVLQVEDLSYWSTFNDEPGTDKYGEFDGPKYEVQKIETWHRVCKIDS